MAEFNNNPSEFIDFNDLFPVLNEKVGLTYEQWRKAIENSNYLKNHLGVTKVAIGNEPEVIIVDNPEDARIDVTVREVKDGDTTTVYLDFVHYVPAGKVTSVNGQTGNVVLSFIEQVYTMPNPSEDYLNKLLAYVGETNDTYVNGDIYKCVSFIDGSIYPSATYYYWVDQNNNLKIMPQTAHGFEGRIVRYIGDTNDTYTYGKFYEYYNRDTAGGYRGAFRESKTYATLDDVNNAINGMWEESY